LCFKDFRKINDLDPALSPTSWYKGGVRCGCDCAQPLPGKRAVEVP